MRLPTEGTVFISVADRDKKHILEIAGRLRKLGFKILATKGTMEYLGSNNIESHLAVKLHEGRPNITDDILNGRIQMIINTPIGSEGKYDDSYIRKSAAQRSIAYVTTIAAARASVEGIESVRSGGEEIKPIQAYHSL